MFQLAKARLRMPERSVQLVVWTAACCVAAMGWCCLGSGQELAVAKQEVEPTGTGAERGAEIWKTQCVQCHGLEGAGVSGRYEHALTGPGTLEELASLIEQTMPEEDPDECVGDDARAVARFLLGGILAQTPAARPLRRELQHLTVGQYLQAIAGIGEALWGRGEVSGQPGLKARYFDGRNFDQKKLVAERVDPQIDFDWKGAGPLGDQTGADEFCIEWSGSIFIEETGDYEWIIRSPNGYRLYLNRQAEPLLDSWVATRDEPEKSARVRLLGGRWYPVRLQALKVKDPAFAIQWLWQRPRRQAAIVPAEVLRPEVVKPVLVVQTPFPADDFSQGYARGTFFSPEWEEATTQAAWEVADLLVPRLPALVGVKAEAVEYPGKCQQFCERFVELAFRRPLSEQERELYVAQMFTNRPTDEAVRLCVLAALKSPWFLYLGIDQESPLEERLAREIALAITDGGGGDEIRTFLTAGQLKGAAGKEAFARRLLDSPAGRAKWREFFADWLSLEEAAEISKDTDTFSQFDEQLRDDLQESVLRFVDDVWTSPEADFRELLLSRDIWMSERMRAVYPEIETAESNQGEPRGIGEAEQTPEGTLGESLGETPAEVAAEVGGFQKVTWASDDRAGLLTHPLLLSQLAYFRTTSPIHRGVFVTRNLLGVPLKPPPVAVDPITEDAAGDLTTRERVELQTKPDNCMGCHRVINPFGFALEGFDSIGRQRQTERGRQVDTTAVVELPGRSPVTIGGARQLAEFLIEQPETPRHFVRAVFQHAVRQPPEGYAPDLLDQLTAEFVEGGFQMRDLVVAIAVRTAAIASGQQEQSEASDSGAADAAVISPREGGER